MDARGRSRLMDVGSCRWGGGGGGGWLGTEVPAAWPGAAGGRVLAGCPQPLLRIRKLTGRGPGSRLGRGVSCCWRRPAHWVGRGRTFGGDPPSCHHAGPWGVGSMMQRPTPGRPPSPHRCPRGGPARQGAAKAAGHRPPLAIGDPPRHTLPRGPLTEVGLHGCPEGSFPSARPILQHEAELPVGPRDSLAPLRMSAQPPQRPCLPSEQPGSVPPRAQAFTLSFRLGLPCPLLPTHIP